MPARPRRRAVGPPGARPPTDEPRLDQPEPEPAAAATDEDRLRADRPPHHDQER